MSAPPNPENQDLMYRILVQWITDYAIYMLDPNGIVSNWNAGAQRAKGYIAEEIVGEHFSRFYSSEDIRLGLPARVLERARTEGRFEGEGWRIRKDGTRFWAHVLIDRISDENGNVIGYAKITRDLTEQKAQADRIAYLAHHDILTGLPNRAVLQDRLDSILKRDEKSSVCALFYLDLDGFKQVNDSLGHGAGDELLRIVAQRIEHALRSSDLVVRFGGDEFVILQEGHGEIQEVEALAVRIIQTLNHPVFIQDRRIEIGVSIGISISAEGGSNPDLLLHNADLALYRAKTDGKNCYRFYDSEMDLVARQRQDFERDLRNALSSHQFELHYQPIVDLDHDTLISFEALLRWNRPGWGVISPSDFIPVAEQLGLMQEIGDWVLKTACEEAVKWPTAISIAINLSPTQLRNLKFVEHVQTILSDTGLMAERLELELTETEIIADTERASVLLGRLREIGIHIALDDFGTGYSSLSFLHRLPLSRIKIDRSFIQNYGEKLEPTAIVQAIIGLCKRLRIHITAEGIETEQQAESLRNVRSIQAQGYLFGQPRPAREIPDVIQTFSQNRGNNRHP